MSREPNNKEKLPVWFRKHGEDIDAVFLYDNQITTYAHVGQFSQGSLGWLFGETKPAKPQEYQSLLKELRHVYAEYELVIKTKLPAYSYVRGILKRGYNMEIYEYIDSVWNFSAGESDDDIQAFWDAGEIDLVCLRLVSAGAVEPNCPEAREMIRIAKSIDLKTVLKWIDEALRDHSTIECAYCNHVGFYSDASEISETCRSCLKPHKNKPRLFK